MLPKRPTFIKSQPQKWYGVTLLAFVALGIRGITLALFQLTNSGESNNQRYSLAKNDDPSNHKNPANFINNNNRTSFPCIDKESPSATEIQQLLTEERGDLKIHKPKTSITQRMWGNDYFEDMAIVYELTYAFVAEFQKNDIPIFLAFGSHIGALRHHGIIPFGEKDVDFAIFSRDHKKNKDIIRKVLDERGLRKDTIKDKNFGYQIFNKIFHTKNSHYFDFWLFEQRDDAEVQCVGWAPTEYPKEYKYPSQFLSIYKNLTGCADWYRKHDYGAREPAVFPLNQWFPPIYQMFGTHKVPIPSTIEEINFQYRGGHYNKFCGFASSGSDNERLCSNRYGDFPFVFVRDDGTEELRQGSVVIHKSSIAAPIANTSVYSKIDLA